MSELFQMCLFCLVAGYNLWYSEPKEADQSALGSSYLPSIPTEGYEAYNQIFEDKSNIRELRKL